MDPVGDKRKDVAGRDVDNGLLTYGGKIKLTCYAGYIQACDISACF